MAKEAKQGDLFHTNERDGVNYRKAKVWEIVFGVATNGVQTGFYLLVGYASMIATTGFGIAVATAGLLLTVCSFIDAATDALVAALIEATNPKHGKIRIYLIAGWLMCGLGAMTLYKWAAGHFTGVAGILMFLLAYNIFRLGYTTVGTAGGMVGIVITNDPTQRPLVGAVATAFCYCVPLIFTNLQTFVILPKYDNQYNTGSLGEMVLVYMLVTGIFLIMTCIGVRRVDVKETFEVLNKDGSKKDEKMSIRDMWAVVKDNRNAQMFIIAGISDKFAQNIGNQSVIYTLLSGVLIGSYAASTMVGNFTQVVGLVFAFGGGILIAKWGAKKATVVWSWISIAVSAVIMVYCFMIGGPTGMAKIGVMGLPLIIYAILQLFKQGSMMVLTTATSAMRGDIVDQEYARSGNYMPAILAGIYSFIDKIISSFSSAIAAACIALVGYTTTIPQMGDKATWPIFWMCMFLTFGLPIIGWLCNVVAMKFYSLDKEAMVEVQKTLAERKAKAEAME